MKPRQAIHNRRRRRRRRRPAARAPPCLPCRIATISNIVRSSFPKFRRRSALVAKRCLSSRPAAAFARTTVLTDIAVSRSLVRMNAEKISDTLAFASPAIRKLDFAQANAYGWRDVKTQHDFLPLHVLRARAASTSMLTVDATQHNPVGRTA
ncbi:hypothetical protein THAOC_09713 [Thalassiosira oceanica]|uniref:Uncharacterized protein n=1 Tax=Thalassiosira oceanica TaxID=159749 RepID=K0SRW4_THAOC|nr:hypothetical protein THAOC_09713 [Thalassiosira oceanica]|eukprot:EJK69068.1 hypothetical protein THAOC_09713 [Thalassiosira oceanica]